MKRVEPLVIREKLPESESVTNSIQPEKHKEPQNPLTRLTANLKNNICDNKHIPDKKNKAKFQKKQEFNRTTIQGQQVQRRYKRKGKQSMKQQRK